MTGSLVRMLAVTAMVVMFLGTSTARAEDDKIRRAKVHYKQGKAYYDAKAYELAVEEYLKAYSLMPLADLHFNVAQSYRLMGAYKRALEYYRLYLEASPTGQAASEAREHVRVLTQKVIEEARAGASPEIMGPGDRGSGEITAGTTTRPDTTKPDTTRPDTTRPDATRPDATRPDTTKPDTTKPDTTKPDTGTAGKPHRVALTPDPVADVTRTASPSSPGKGMRIAGLATAGVGVIALGLGIKYGLDASSLSSELSDHTGPWTEEILDKEAQGESANSKFLLFTGVGAVAIIGGGVLYMLGRKQAAGGEQSRAVSLHPVLAPDGMTVALSGRF